MKTLGYNQLKIAHLNINIHGKKTFLDHMNSCTLATKL